MKVKLNLGYGKDIRQEMFKNSIKVNKNFLNF